MIHIRLFRFNVVLVTLVMLLSACTAQPASSPSAGHGGHGSTASTAPYDAQFIDGMIVHHQGAVTMAQQALKESQRLEIRQLAENIISTQQTEITQLQTWRKQWYPNLPQTQGTSTHMGDMEISKDASKPFDQRFLMAMISHHEGALAMAKEAQAKAERAEIKQLAAEIIKAQEAEISLMKQWNKQWFNA